MSEHWSHETIGSTLSTHFSGAWGVEPRSGLPITVVLRSTDIDDDGHVNLASGALRSLSAAERNAKTLQFGDILMEASGGGPGKPVGRTAWFPGAEDEQFSTSNFFKVLRADTAKVDRKFLAWRLLWLSQRPDIWQYQQQTTGIINLKFRDYLNYRLDLPPIPDQYLIAEILDTVDAEIRASGRVIRKLEVMRTGLVDSLLRPSGLRSQDPPWRTHSVRDTGTLRLGRQRSPEHESGRHMRPYLRVANVFDGWIDYSDVLTMNFSPSEQDVYDLRSGDILLNEGQSLDLVGRCAIYDGDEGAYCFQNTLIRFRPDRQVVIPEFARIVFKDWLDRGVFMRVALQTTSVAHLGSDRFARMQMAVPPIEEQMDITARVGALDDRITLETELLAKRRLTLTGLMSDLLGGYVLVSKGVR
jgi:type I restriction enzyme S subunit